MVTGQYRRLNKLKTFERAGEIKWINTTKKVGKEWRQSLILKTNLYSTCGIRKLKLFYLVISTYSLKN